MKGKSTTFEELGFLSDEVHAFIGRHRKDLAVLFDLADELHAYAHRQLRRCKVNGQDLQHLVGISLFLRILNSFSAIVLLAERGMCHDAEAIARVSLEALFFLKRSAEEKDFVSEFVKLDQHQRLKLMNVAKDSSSSLHETIGKDPRFDQLFAELKNFVDEENVREQKACEVAKKAGLSDLYDFAYRTLSQSVHPNPRALLRYITFDENDEAQELVLAPESDAIPLVVATGISTLLVSLRLISALFDEKMPDIDKFEARFAAESKREDQR